MVLAAKLFAESDRSVVVLSATILDDTLARLIGRRIGVDPAEKEFEHIFRTEGPLGSFSHRIEIAYLFNLIDDVTYKELHIAREMRNACAHSMQPLDFATTALANVAKQFFRSRILPVSTDTHDDIRRTFITEFIIVFTILSEGSRAAGIAKIGPSLL